VEEENLDKNSWANMWKWLLANKINEEIYYNFKYPDIVTKLKDVDWNGLGM
jgi:hypothetical protein